MLFCRVSAALALTLLSAACSTTSAQVDLESEITDYDIAIQQDQAFSMIVMYRNDDTDVASAQERGRITQAHMDFNAEQKEQGYMLAAGPAVPPRADNALRSFAFVDNANTADAYARACSDPACEAGMLQCEVMPFVTQDNLRALPGMERSMQSQLGSDRVAARPYVLAQCETSAAIDAMIAKMGPVVVFSGHCTGGSCDGSTFMVIDCRTVGEARTLMSAMGPASEGFTYHPWVSNQSLRGIAR